VKQQGGRVELAHIAAIGWDIPKDARANRGAFSRQKECGMLLNPIPIDPDHAGGNGLNPIPKKGQRHGN
jgi:hypothetical protein